MHGIERSRRLQGPVPPEAGVYRVVVRYSDGREYYFKPEAGRGKFSEDDMLQLAMVFDSASGVSEWASLSEQESRGG